MNIDLSAPFPGTEGIFHGGYGREKERRRLQPSVPRDRGTFRELSERRPRFRAQRCLSGQFAQSLFRHLPQRGFRWTMDQFEIGGI